MAKGVAKASEVLELMRSGAVDGLSIGFKTIKAKAGTGGIRHIHEADLWEISVVTFPMLPSARVGQVKSLPADAMPDKDYSNQRRLLWNIKANEVLIEALKRSPQSDYNGRWLARLQEENAELKSHSTLYEPFQIWVRKYNPHQPRVSAGNADGGQWTDGGGGSGGGKPLSSEAFDRRWNAGGTGGNTRTGVDAAARGAIKKPLAAGASATVGQVGGSARMPGRAELLKLGKVAAAAAARGVLRTALGTAGFYIAMTSPAGGGAIDQTFNAPDGSSVRLTGKDDELSREVEISSPRGDRTTLKLQWDANNSCLILQGGTHNDHPLDDGALAIAAEMLQENGLGNVVLSEDAKERSSARGAVNAGGSAAAGAPEPDDDEKPFKRPNDRLLKDDRIDLSKFKERVKLEKNRRGFRDPKSGYTISKDDAGPDAHDGPWKLLDRFGKRVGTITEDGRFLRKMRELE